MNTSIGKQLASLPQFSDQRVGAQVSDLRLARAKECEITPKDGAKWGVQRKSPESRGPSPCRSPQDPPLLSLDEESSSAPSPSCSTPPPAYKDDEPPGAPKRKSKKDQDIGADIFEDLEGEPEVFDPEALEQALESAQEEFSTIYEDVREHEGYRAPPLSPGTPDINQSWTIGMQNLSDKHLRAMGLFNAWIIGPRNLTEVVARVNDVLNKLLTEILSFNGILFQWECRIWDSDYKSSYQFSVELFEDVEKSEPDKLLFYMVKICPSLIMGLRSSHLEEGFRFDFVKSVASGAESLPDDVELKRHLALQGLIRNSTEPQQVESSEEPRYNEVDYFQYQREDYVDPLPAWVSKNVVMEIFGEDYTGSQAGVHIEIIILAALNRLFTEKEEFSIDDILLCLNRLLANERLVWNYYFLCSKGEYLREFLSEKTLVASEVGLLVDLQAKLEEISGSEKSSDLLKGLATKAKEEVGTCVPQLVKGGSRLAPGGGGGGGGK